MAKKKKRLVLLDAHAIIHRAYHALPDFTSGKGEPSGALYGLSSMLLRIITDLSPDHIAACYDLPKPTVRHEAYSDYKATRQKTDDALILQLNRSKDVFKAFCIPIYERAGFEADDILGTIVRLTSKHTDLEVVIASGDMDTLQLVEKDRVKVYTLKRGLNETTLFDEKGVIERFQFPPALIPDYKGLRGDPSDNIKGVPGIGDKTATTLITSFGDVESMYKALKKDEEAFVKAGITPRIINLLKTHKEDALFSKMLATIRTDAPIAFRLEETETKNGTRLPKVLALFDELSFRSLRERAKAALSTTEEEDEEEEAPKEAIDEGMFKEAQVMLWLLHSEFTNPSLEDILAYAEVETLSKAHPILSKQLEETGKLKQLYEEIEKPLIPVVDGMKEHGVLVDSKQLEKLRVAYTKEVKEIEARIFKAVGHEFNVASPKQLSTVLFDELHLVAKGQKKTSTGQRSTRESELEKIKDLHPVVEDVLLYREIQKLLSTYIESIPPLLDSENRLHATFVQTGTSTGRMSSQDPNLQNIPIRTDRGRAIRNTFIAPKGYTLLALDYSQIELRIAAILSGDEKFCEIFKNGRDVHREVAAEVFDVPPEKVDAEMRRQAKIINFGILYGMGVNSLRQALGTTTAAAHTFYDDYFKTFSTLSKHLEKTKGFARKHGYTETLFGRRRQFPEMKSPLPYVRAQAERTAINAPIQGTQSDIIKKAMVLVDEMLQKEASGEAHLLLQVHDELVYEVKSEKLEVLAGKIKHIMETILPLSETHGIPLTVEAKVGENWGEMQTFTNKV